MVVESKRFKDCCCIQKHDRFRGPSLLVFGVVDYDCSTDVCVILFLNGVGTVVHYRDEILEAFVHLYACAVGQDFVLMYENACPHCTGLPPPLMLIQQSMYWTLHTRLFRSGQEFLILKSGN